MTKKIKANKNKPLRKNINSFVILGLVQNSNIHFLRIAEAVFW